MKLMHLFYFTILLLSFSNRVMAEDVPVVAAASDLQFALQDVVDLFHRNTGNVIKPSFGSSGNFRRQIAQGAPFQMFLSADEDHIFALYREGRTLNEGVLYAIGRIVLMIPHGSPLKADGTLTDLAAALTDKRLTRFAIASPEHAPYGKRAEEALRYAGLWESIQTRLVFGENVSQTAQFATSGSAQGGIIAYSLALSPNIAQLGNYAIIPAEWHSPLRQRMALLKGAGATAQAFYEFMQSPPARAILQRYGFALPDETD